MQGYKKNLTTSSIFDPSIPIAKDNYELAKLKEDPKYKDMDDYYIASASIPERKLAFDKLWGNFRELADKHFLSDIKRNFHDRSWEMYIGDFFKQNEKKVYSGNSGPDFILNSSIYVECVVSTLGQNLKPPQLNEGHTIPNKELQLRIRSSIENKKEQYEKWWKDKAIESNRPYILAINTFLHYPEHPIIPRIIQSLFGVGDFKLLIDRRTEETESIIEYEDNLIKSNGSKVEKSIFNTDSYSFISAIIFSSNDVLNSILSVKDNNWDDLQIVKNPNATNPIGRNQLNYIKDYPHTFNYE